MSEQSTIYLVYEYRLFFDSERALMRPAYTHLDDARALVEREGAMRYDDYKQEKDKALGAPITRWREEKSGELLYEVSCESMVYRNGKWDGGIGRWAIVPFTLTPSRLTDKGD